MTKSKKKKEPYNIDDDLYYFPIKMDLLKKEGNPVLRQKRIHEIPLAILKVWIKRYVIIDEDPDKFYGHNIDKENEEIIFWFQFEMDKNRFMGLIKDIEDNGMPTRKKY
jgi:hypothetical protein